MAFNVTSATNYGDFITGLQSLPHLLEKPADEQALFDPGARAGFLIDQDKIAGLKQLYQEAKPTDVLAVVAEMAPLMSQKDPDVEGLNYIQRILRFHRAVMAETVPTAAHTDLDKADLTSFRHYQRIDACNLIDALRQGMKAQLDRVPAQYRKTLVRILDKMQKVIDEHLAQPDISEMETVAKTYEDNKQFDTALQIWLETYGLQVEAIAAGTSPDVERLEYFKTQYERVRDTCFSNPSRPALGFHQNFAGITDGKPLGTANLRSCITLFFTAQNGETLGVHFSQKADLDKLPAMIGQLQGPLQVSVVGARNRAEDATSEANLKKLHKFFTQHPDIASRCTFIKADIDHARGIDHLVYDPKTKIAYFERPAMTNNLCHEAMNNMLLDTPELNLSFDSRKATRAFPMKVSNALLEASKKLPASPIERVRYFHDVILHNARSDQAAYRYAAMYEHMLGLKESVEASIEARQTFAGLFPAWINGRKFRDNIKQEAIGAVAAVLPRLPVYFGDNADIANAPVAELLSNPGREWIRNNDWVQIEKGNDQRVTGASAFVTGKLVETAQKRVPKSGMDAILEYETHDRMGVGSMPSSRGEKKD